MANEKGVWRTIGGRRVFIKEGQDLASAMKESGKFKSASKGGAKKEMTHQEASEAQLKRAEKEYKDVSELRDEYEDRVLSKADEDSIKESMQKVAKQYEEDKKNGKVAERLKEIEDYERKTRIKDKKIEKVLEDFKDSDGSKEKFEKALNKISEMEYNNEINPDDYKESISKIQKEYVEKNRKANSDREALRNIEKEYSELSKKMQADDYYYKPEDDKKLQELRAKADVERVRQGIDTQEKYDKLMSEDSKTSSKEQFKVSNLSKKGTFENFEIPGQNIKGMYNKETGEVMYTTGSNSSNRNEYRVNINDLKSEDFPNTHEGFVKAYLTKEKTTSQSMNDTLRNEFDNYRKKHKNSNMSFTEFMRINKK